MADERKHEDRLAVAVRELAGAEALAFGGVGLAGKLLPATVAYQEIEDALPDQATALRPELTRLLATASPAGRAYAATLLHRMDPAAGREAWRSLLTEAGEFTTFQGCLMDRTTLGEYARAQLDRN